MRLYTLTLGILITSMTTFGQSKIIQKNSTEQTQKENSMGKKNADTTAEFTPTDLKLFKYCLNLAEEALKAGDQPFGSILVNADNKIIAEARNRVNEKNALAHPEIELAQWAMDNLSFEDRQQTKMYISGEHCPMCAGAHSWSQIGYLYFLSSAEQLGKWLQEFEVNSAPIQFIPAEKIIKNVMIKGPVKGEMLLEIKQMHKRYYVNN